MTDRFDIIILGGGNAGFGVSAIAAEAGKHIAFVEERDFGGTCPNRGCTPKKVLVAAAHALHEVEMARAHCIETGPVTIDWAKLIDREQAMISHIPDAMAGLAAKRGTVFRGSARFVGPNAVEVDGQRLEADNIVIATGSVPRPLPIPGAELMITSDEVLTERTLPASVVFIGGGVIAMEFSHVYTRAGSKVTILEAMGVRVRDMGSTNGTQVNGQRVPAAELKHGDKVTIGEHCFQYVIEERSRSGRAYKVH